MRLQALEARETYTGSAAVLCGARERYGIQFLPMSCVRTELAQTTLDRNVERLPASFDGVLYDGGDGPMGGPE